MKPQADLWNSLEVVKLIIGILMPLTLAWFGLFVHQRLKRIDLSQWSNQKLIEKRLALYDSIAPLLNNLLCFYTWVGDWKEISPEDVIKAKRECDKAINIYRHIFDDEVFERYQHFIHTLFETYTGLGHDAKIRSIVSGPNGDRRSHCTYEWNENWNSSFSPDKVADLTEVKKKYYELMASLRRSIGIKG